MQPLQIKLFLEKFAIGTHTEEEHLQFVEWLKTAPMADVEAIAEEYNEVFSSNASLKETDKAVISQIELALDQSHLSQQRRTATVKIIPWKFFFKLAAASVIIFTTGLAIYLASKTTANNTIVKTAPRQIKNVGMPGGNKAILTLSDGSSIILDDAKNGTVAKQGDTRIAKLANGQIIYKALDDNPANVVFNTLTTPRGGQFKLTLPDGSDVWLNSVSSIKYPTSFTGKERQVDITGEAYFEIAHDASKPFKVNVNGMEVKVLGTHFNINAYDDEVSVKTTLLEGSVSLKKAGSSTTLKPGQQAQVASNSAIRIIDNADIEQVVAWKNGYFSFNRADIKTVMRQVARWYDLEISYEGKFPDREFGGKIDRNSNLAEVLKILEESKVHFKMEERKIVVSR